MFDERIGQQIGDIIAVADDAEPALRVEDCGERGVG